MINIFEKNAVDFSTHGLAVLTPTACKVHEVQGGAYELELEHPMDTAGLYDYLADERIIKVPVPCRTTPAAFLQGLTEQEFWRTTGEAKIYSTHSTNIGREVAVTKKKKKLKKGFPPSAAVYVEKERHIIVGAGAAYAKWKEQQYETYTTKQWVKGDSSIIETVKPNRDLLVLDKSIEGWLKVVCESGAVGWVERSSAVFDRIVPSVPAENIQERKTREQLFRVYRVEKNTHTLSVKAWARHIYYDLVGNIVLNCKKQNAKVGDVLTELSRNATQPDHGFSFYTDKPDVELGDVDYTHSNLVKAHLEPETGVLSRANLRIVRDNFDIFFIGKKEIIRAPIVYGGGLRGVSVDMDSGVCVNRIIPVGKDKDGNPILPDEKYVDSPNMLDGDIIHAQVMEFDLREKTQTEDSPALTISAIKTKLVELANAEFEKGIDLPIIEMDVDFLQLGDTEEYKQYRELDRLYLGDLTSVKDLTHGIEVQAEMTEYEFDCLAGRYNSARFGVMDASRTVGSVSGYELARNAVSGTRIARGAVDNSRLQDLAVTNAKIGLAAIKEANIDNAAITSAKIADAAINNAKISEAGIDYAKIKDLVAGTAIIEAGIGEKLIIKRLSVTDANIVNLAAGKLLVQGQDGAMYQLTVDADGTVSTIKKQIGNNDVKNESLHAREKIIKGTIVADLLDVQEIFANSALIGAIKAQNIAAEAITVNHLAADVGRTLDLSSNESIKLEVSNAIKEGVNLFAHSENLSQWEKESNVTVTLKDDDYFEIYTYISGGYGRWGIMQTVAVEPNTAYKLNVDVRQYMRLQFKEYSSLPPENDYPDASSMAYTAVEGRFDLLLFTSADTRFIRFYFHAYTAESQYCYIKNPKLEKTISALKTSHVELRDNLIDIKSGGIVNIESGGHLNLSGGTVQIDAQESSNSHINLGDVFSVGENQNGEFELHLNAKSDAMKVNGNNVWHKGNIIVSQAQPASGNGVIWIKPNTASEVIFSKLAASGRSFYFGWGYGANGYLNFDLMSQSQGIISAGALAVTLTFILTRKGSGAIGSKNYGRVEVFLKKGGKTLSAVHPDDLILRPYQSQAFSFNFSTASSAFTEDINSVACGIRVTRPQYNDRDYLCFKTPSDITAKFVTSGGGAGAGLCEVRYVP